MSTLPVVGTGTTQATPSSGLPLYQRKYSLQLLTPSGSDTNVLTVTDSSWEPEALRITFDTQQVGLQSNYWFADIVIYNADKATATAILQASSNISQGMIAVLRAGYIGGPENNIIWQGPVFQPLWVRENVVDYKITLRCILSLESAISGNTISANYGAGSSQYDVVIKMIESLGLQPGTISPNLSTKPMSRGFTWFGSPDKELDRIVRGNNMLWWLDMDGKVNIGHPNDGQVSEAPTIVYTPTTGLIGTPEQTQYGVNFTVLLDPRLKVQMPMLTAAINNAAIRQYQIQYGSYNFLPLDQDGVYVIGSVRHRGDSRGNAWYTDVTGFVKVGDALAWAALANINH